MSIRVELEELVKWISDLQAKQKEPAPKPFPAKEWRNVQAHLELASEQFAEASRLLTVIEESVFAELAGDLHREAEGLALRANMLSLRAAQAPEPGAQPAQPPPAGAQPGAQPAQPPPAGAQPGAQPAQPPPAGAQPGAEPAKPPPAGAQPGAEPAKPPRAGTQVRSTETKNDPEGAGNDKERDNHLDPRQPAHGSSPACAPEDPPFSIALIESAGGSVESARQTLDAVEDLDNVAKGFEEELDVLAEMTLGLLQDCKWRNEPGQDEKQRMEMEKQRVELEKQRIQREEQRIQAEEQRMKLEKPRVEEEQRKALEEQRTALEEQRKLAEEQWKLAEEQRKLAESEARTAERYGGSRRQRKLEKQRGELRKKHDELEKNHRQEAERVDSRQETS